MGAIGKWSYRKMVCLPAAPPALALRRWLGLGLFMLLCLSLGYALEKKTFKSKVGEKIGLPCCHEIPSSESLSNYRVYWQKTPKVVVSAYSEEGKMPSDKQFENRTEMDLRNLTLWIYPVEILDNGSYQCVVQNRKLSQNTFVVCDETVNLSVTADFSTPNVTADIFNNSCESAEMEVRCSSHGGFPRPKISGALNNKSVEWNDSLVSESSFKLYNVTAKVWISVTEDTNFTCSVEYNGFATSTSLLLKKTNDCVVPTEPPSFNVIIASSIIIIIFLLAITLAARYLPRYVILYSVEEDTWIQHFYGIPNTNEGSSFSVCSHCCKPQDSVEEGMKECTKPPMSAKVTSETSSV